MDSNIIRAIINRFGIRKINSATRRNIDYFFLCIEEIQNQILEFGQTCTEYEDLSRGIRYSMYIEDGSEPQLSTNSVISFECIASFGIDANGITVNFNVGKIGDIIILYNSSYSGTTEWGQLMAIDNTEDITFINNSISNIIDKHYQIEFIDSNISIPTDVEELLGIKAKINLEILDKL